jgi:predicted O-linked N-acetylglucosamine transferase (SPINDLY family)
MDTYSLCNYVSSVFLSENKPTDCDVDYLINYYKQHILPTNDSQVIFILKDLTTKILQIPIFSNKVYALIEIALSANIIYFGRINKSPPYTSYFIKWILVRIILFKIIHNFPYEYDVHLYNISDEPNIQEMIKNSSDEKIQFMLKLSSLFISLWNNNVEEIIEERTKFQKILIEIVATQDKWKSNELLGPYDTLPFWYVQPAFGLTYHASNNSAMFGLLAQFYTRLCSLRFNSTALLLNANSKLKNTPLRIGFISRTFYNHSICRISLGLIEQLYKYDDIDIYIYSTTSQNQDKFSQRIYNSSTKYTQISSINFIESVETIRHDNLDALVILDPCTDIYTYCIGLYRCAPLQLTTWGHPETSGSPNIDYYITSKYFEKQTDNIYYEKPYIMNSLSFYYYNLQNTYGFDPIEMFNNTSQITLRQGFSLPENGHIYGILSTPFKFHPSFDKIIDTILLQDTNGYVVILINHIDFLNKIIERFNKTINKAHINRIIALPYQTEMYAYEKLILSCDVILDTFPFGGCITTFDAFSCNKCVITLPGDKLCGRFTQGLYNRMTSNFEDLIKTDENKYIEAALKVATYPPFRRTLEKRIADNKHKLYEDKASIEEWYQFFKTHC